jgi:hypothetical protein
MPLTSSAEVVATAIFSIIQAQVIPLGVNVMYYGDQTILDKTPAVCVSPGNKTREWEGASLGTRNVFETYVYVYYGKIQDVQVNLHAAQTLADAIEPVVHANITLGGIVIGTLCTQNEPGVINKMGSLLMGNRMTFESFSKTRLP